MEYETLVGILAIKKSDSYIKIKERPVAVSQDKIFCSGALTQHFFPASAIFASLYTQTVVLWKLVLPLKPSYLSFPTKSLIRMREPCIYRPNKRTRNIKRGTDLRKGCLGITNHLCSVCSSLTFFLWGGHGQGGGGVAFPLCMEIIS